MKKLLALFLIVVLCLSLSACGDGSIELTVDNYDDYLSVGASISNPSFTDGVHVSYGIPYPNGEGGTYYIYEYLNARLNVEGKSTNFNYNDVVVTIKFNGKYRSHDLNDWSQEMPIELELTANCDISGCDLVTDKFTDSGSYLHEEAIYADWEIVSISGTVTPAG